MHDCRNDSANLYNEFDIRINNVFDTQSAHIVIQSEDGKKGHNVGLNQLCKLYKTDINPCKDSINVGT
jgi:exonuclease 3'-5' domain-containing protein 1